MFPYGLLTQGTIKSHISSRFCALTCTQWQINTAITSLKCTSPACFPLEGSVPVRTLAQNSQSASSVGDSLSDSTSPAWLEMCFLHLYHYDTLPVSFTTTKKKKTAAMQLHCVNIVLILSGGGFAGVHPSACRCARGRGIVLKLGTAATF